MSDLGSLEGRIATAGPNLTPTERRLANIVLEDPTTVAFGTVADVARQAETSGPSVVRFAAKLEFDGYGDLQDHVRTSLTERLRRPTDRLRAGASADRMTRQTTTAVRTLQRTFDALNHEVISQVAQRLAAADTVWGLCATLSATPGQLLVANLQLLRPNVKSLTGPAAVMAADIADAGPGDVAIVIDFPRYESMVLDGASRLAKAGVWMAAITDGPLSPLAAIADNWLGTDVDAVGPFDSVVPAVAVVEVLLAEVAWLLRDDASDRLDRIERLWSETSTFHSEQQTS